MIVVASHGRVPAPVDDVWAVVRRVEALPIWLTGVRQVVADGPEGLGRPLWLAGPHTGQSARDPDDQGIAELDIRAEIIAWKPPTLLAWRHVTRRAANGWWEPARPDETHVQLLPAGGQTEVRLWAIHHAGLIEACWLRLGQTRRWRADLSRSVAALAGMFITPMTTTSPPGC